ncbi:hypothetical protein [Sphingomonas sp.]|uniref:hypothetical protein n=1 Tax=Sphingomonas sp. TaxID=28214 RepID=UPI0025E97069|nr:hypothetical protein [Sphingomonas sp.]
MPFGIGKRALASGCVLRWTDDAKEQCPASRLNSNIATCRPSRPAFAGTTARLNLVRIESRSTFGSDFSFRA